MLEDVFVSWLYKERGLDDVVGTISGSSGRGDHDTHL